MTRERRKTTRSHRLLIPAGGQPHLYVHSFDGFPIYDITFGQRPGDDGRICGVGSDEFNFEWMRDNYGIDIPRVRAILRAWRRQEGFVGMVTHPNEADPVPIADAPPNVVPIR